MTAIGINCRITSNGKKIVFAFGVGNTPSLMQYLIAGGTNAATQIQLMSIKILRFVTIIGYFSGLAI